MALAIVLAMGLALAACNGGGNGSSPSSDDPTATKYKLAFNNWGQGAEVFDWHEDEIVYIVKDLLGMDIQTASDENSADGILRNVNNFVSAGVDGILMTCNLPELLPQLATSAKNAKIPFNLSIWVGNDDDRNALIDNNDYFTGSFYADTYAEAYALGKIAVADGHKTSVLVGANLGDPSIETRIEGWTQAFVTEGGGQILDIARCSGPPESKEKSGAMLSANPDADCMYVMVGDFFNGAYEAMQELGITPQDMIVYCSLCSTETSNYIKDGIIKDATGGHDLVCHLAVVALVNYLDGHPIVDANGKPPMLTLQPFLVNKDNADVYMDIFFDMTDGQHVLKDDYLKSLLWRYNPDVKYQDYIDFLNNFSLEWLIEMHGK